MYLDKRMIIYCNKHEILPERATRSEVRFRPTRAKLALSSSRVKNGEGSVLAPTKKACKPSLLPNGTDQLGPPDYIT